MNTVEMRLRKALPEDAPAMRALFRDTVATINSRDYSPQQIAVWMGSAEEPEREVRLQMRIANQYFLVAERAGKMLGFSSLSKEGYLDLFYVHKDHQREGVGRLMMSALLAEARRLGLGEVTSDVSHTARPFFERSGFLEVKESTFVLEGVSLTNHHMRWKP